MSARLAFQFANLNFSCVGFTCRTLVSARLAFQLAKSLHPWRRLHGQASWHRFSSIPTPSETMMPYLALWVRINCIHKCLICSSFGYLRGVYIFGMTRNNIDLQGQAVHHSISGDWEVYMVRHHGIDFHLSQPPVKL